MKPERVYLDELNATTKAYKVKVKVIEKGRAKTSPQKGTTYQNLLLEDDKGNRMRGALFGDQVDCYKDALVYNGVYEIANAPIRKSDPQWKTTATNLDFQMSFGSNTVIQPIDLDSKTKLPEYSTLGQIPKAVNDTEKYDVLGILVYMEQKPRKIITAQSREVSVREMLIVDHSVGQPVIVSAWNELAEDDCENLVPGYQAKNVVAFTALRVSSFKGFSLTTTMSTTIISEPGGERADKLKQWAANHGTILDDMHKRVMAVKDASDERVIKTIMELHMKHARNTLQEERHWLRITVKEPDFNKLNAYLGCSSCGKRSDVPAGNKFDCETCLKKETISCPRVSFNCEVEDTSGQLSITAFTNDTEKLFGQTAPDLFRIKHSGDKDAFATVSQRLQAKNLLIQVGPKATLSRNNVLQWVLKKVECEVEPVTKPTEPDDDGTKPLQEEKLGEVSVRSRITRKMSGRKASGRTDGKTLTAAEGCCELPLSDGFVPESTSSDQQDT